MSQSPQEQKKLLVQLHQYTKQLLLLSEETGPGAKSLMQAVREHRDAYEHIIRVFAMEVGAKPADDPEKYIHDNLNSAIGHECRAFFDIADYMCVMVTDRFTLALRDYSHSVISSVRPTYYTEEKPRLLALREQISHIRGKKDVADFTACANLVENYFNVVNELLNKANEIEQAIPVLEEAKSNETAKESKGIRINIIVAVVVSVLTFFATLLFT